MVDPGIKERIIEGKKMIIPGLDMKGMAKRRE